MVKYYLIFPILNRQYIFFFYRQVNCDGVDAFGKRKKRQAPERNSLALEGFQEGALREEIMVQSNAILTFEKKENQIALPTEGNIHVLFIHKSVYKHSFLY